jgi:hypothetical protein
MDPQNNNQTYPYFLDTLDSNYSVQNPVNTNTDSQYQVPKSQKKLAEEFLNLRSQVDKIEDLRASKNFFALVVNALSVLGLLFVGKLFTELSFIFAILLMIVFVTSFVVSGVYVSVLKTSRNIVWLQVFAIFAFVIFWALLTGNVLSGSLWAMLILVIFTTFVAFLEVESYMRLNRIFLFKIVTAQGRKLLVLSALVLIAMGAFLSINAVGGRKFIENTITNPQVYDRFVDPSGKNGKGIGQQLINSKQYSQLVNPKTPEIYYTFLMAKVEESTNDKKTLLDPFISQNPGCKDSLKQTDTACIKSLETYARDKFLPSYTKKEFGINLLDPTSKVNLDTTLTEANVKFLVINYFGNYFDNAFVKENKASNPSIIYSVLGKKDSVSLLLALLLFFILLVFYIPMSAFCSIISGVLFNALKNAKVVRLAVVKEDCEMLLF